jgi:hypothetical protein
MIKYISYITDTGALKYIIKQECLVTYEQKWTGFALLALEPFCEEPALGTLTSVKVTYAIGMVLWPKG